MTKKSFKAKHQGTLKVVWNVVDNKRSTRLYQFTGDGARSNAIKIAKWLNEDKRYFPLPPVCLNCGWIFGYPSEKIYQKALKEIDKKGK